MIFDPRSTSSTAWLNEPLTLFHGTISAHVASIERGLDLRWVRRRSDFGRGFYTTTSERQARVWAGELARRMAGSAPAIVRFALPREVVAELRCLWFVRGDPEAEEYWRFVQYCRTGGRTHRVTALGGWYDVVAGPVSRDWERRRILSRSDQVSFHTERALAVLMRGYLGSSA